MSKPTKVIRMQRKNAKNRIGNVTGNAFFRVHFLSFSIYCVKIRKNHKNCGFFGTPGGNRTHNCPLGVLRGCKSIFFDVKNVKKRAFCALFCVYFKRFYSKFQIFFVFCNNFYLKFILFLYFF